MYEGFVRWVLFGFPMARLGVRYNIARDWYNAYIDIEKVKDADFTKVVKKLLQLLFAFKELLYYYTSENKFYRTMTCVYLLCP